MHIWSKMLWNCIAFIVVSNVSVLYFLLHSMKRKNLTLYIKSFIFKWFLKVILLDYKIYSYCLAKIIKINDFIFFIFNTLSLLCTFYLTIQFYVFLQILLSDTYFLLSVTYFFVISHVLFVTSHVLFVIKLHTRNIDIIMFLMPLNIIK